MCRGGRVDVMTKDDEDEDNSSVLRDVIVQMFDFPLSFS